MCPFTDALYVKHEFKISKYMLEVSDDPKSQKWLVLKNSVVFNGLQFPLNGAHDNFIYFGDTLIVTDFGS